MRVRNLVMAMAAVATLTAGVVEAANSEKIEPKVTGPVSSFGGSVAQSFTPTMSGVVREVTVWSLQSRPGQAGELAVHAGALPGNEVARTAFVWEGNPTVVHLDRPVAVAAGKSYAMELSGITAAVIFGADDPYAGGEFAYKSMNGWTTWSELVNRCGGCLPFIVDQRFSLEIVQNDADGDGVLDADDQCPATVLPDPSLDRLLNGRFAATPDGIVGPDGAVVATLADTGGCSTVQIIDAYGLGLGHVRFGLTRPHVERWIAGVLGS